MMEGILVKSISLVAAAAVAAALIATPCGAGAATETLHFSGLGQFGPMSGRMVLNVVGDLAISGTGSIRGVGISGAQTLTLITPSTPGSSGYPSGIGWRDGGGTDTWGYDNLVPMLASDPLNGMVFSFGDAGVSWGHGYQFGIWNNGPYYQGWMSGPKGVNEAFYGETGALTVGAPEASTWAMLLLGFAALGYAAHARTRKQLIAIPIA